MAGDNIGSWVALHNTVVDVVVAVAVDVVVDEGNTVVVAEQRSMMAGIVVVGSIVVEVVDRLQAEKRKGKKRRRKRKWRTLSCLFVFCYKKNVLPSSIESIFIRTLAASLDHFFAVCLF